MNRFVSRRWALARRLMGLLGLVSAALPPPTNACDICAVYTATEQSESRTGPSLGLATQYTHFGTLQENGHEVPNPNGEYVESVITQLLFGYQLTPRIGLQLNLPIITREFRRLQEDGRVRGNVAGPGDLSILAHVLAHSIVTETSIFRFSLLGGLKLPSGDSSRLSEELAEVSATAAGVRRRMPRHTVSEPETDGGGGNPAAHASGVHGHDLTLGSGSVDGIVGGDLYWSWKRGFLTASMQYAIRTEGSFDYQFANDLTWAGGPGAYVLLEHDYTLALQALLSGETKGKDTQLGVRLDDTAVTNLFLGPRVLFTWGTSLALEGALDLPVLEHNTSLQIVPDYRLRGAAIWRF